MREEKITRRRIHDALLIERERLKRSRAEEAERELVNDWERVQRGLSLPELESMIKKYDPRLAPRIIDGALELGKRGLKRSKDLTRRYGPVVVKRVKDTTTKYSPVVGKGIADSAEILSLLYRNLVERPVGWTYTNWVATPLSRVYGTLERAIVDSPVTQSAVETTGNVTRTGIKYAAISLALIVSAMLAADAYRPGTTDRVLRQTSKAVQEAVQELQKLYYGNGEILSVPQSIPQYNRPESVPNIPRSQKI